MSDRPKCSDCRSFLPYDGSNRGACRKLPPVFQVGTQQSWPEVWDTDWCGAFEAEPVVVDPLPEGWAPDGWEWVAPRRGDPCWHLLGPEGPRGYLSADSGAWSMYMLADNGVGVGVRVGLGRLPLEAAKAALLARVVGVAHG